MNTISYHSPGTLLLTGNGQLRANLYMKLGLVFTTYIPLRLSIANNVFFCPVTMLLKILLEFFTFGLIFYCPQKFSAIIIHSPFQSVMNILNNAFSCLSHEIIHSFHRLFIPPLHTSWKNWISEYNERQKMQSQGVKNMNRKIMWKYVQMGKQTALLPALYCLPGTQTGLDLSHVHLCLCCGGTAQGHLPVRRLYTHAHVCLQRGRQHFGVPLRKGPGLP